MSAAVYEANSCFPLGKLVVLQPAAGQGGTNLTKSHLLSHPAVCKTNGSWQAGRQAAVACLLEQCAL